MYTNLLIPLDGSTTAEKVLPYGRSLAGKLGIPVELIGIVDIAAMATHMAAEKARYLDAFIAAGERSSDDYLKRIAKTFPGQSVKCSVAKGRPEEAIIEKAAAEKGTLIAMATHGRSGINRWLLGSVAEKVLRGTANPLLLVRATEHVDTVGEANLKSVVVPLDGSKLAESVLPSATSLAKLLNLEVILLRAYDLPATAYYGSEDYLPNYEELKSRLKDEARSYLETKVTALKLEGLAKVTPVLMEGSGADEIISFARKNPDTLVAMCTHGRSGVKRWVLGSVTEKVVRHSDDPVLVVRGN
jgi:nucleotide-binding universal stress UspA family protein